VCQPTQRKLFPLPGPGRALAISCVLACLAASVGCGVASHGRNVEGVRLYQQGKYQEAVARFQSALQASPNNAEAYYNLAATYHQTAKVSGSKADLDTAESYYNQAIDKDPNQVDAYRGLAVLLTDEHRKDDAYRLLQGWVDRSPTLASPRIELARLYEESGDREKAISYLQNALTIDPYDSRALAALGRLHEQVGNPSQALADYQRSLWYNKFQPDVAARVAALQTAINPQPLTTPGATRTVTAPAAPAAPTVPIR
jgi:tetratricopeptide (TPR) repeat protein